VSCKWSTASATDKFRKASEDSGAFLVAQLGFLPSAPLEKRGKDVEKWLCG